MMKKISLLGTVFFGLGLKGMEPVGGHLERIASKQKDLQSNSSGSSSSKGAISAFEEIDLEVGKEPVQSSSTIIVRSIEDLERMLKERGFSVNDGKSKRNSIVYVPKMDIDAIKRENTPPSGEEDFKGVVVVFKEHLKNHGGKDISKIERRLAEKFREIHQTPPNSPLTANDMSTLKQAQKAIEVLHKASIHQSTLRTRREQEVRRSPALSGTRDPKPAEIVDIVAKENPEVQSDIKVLEDLAFKLLTEKLTETQDSKTWTMWVTAGIGFGGTIISGVISGVLTYIATKKSSN